MKYLIRICSGPRCKENFSDDLLKAAKKAARDYDQIGVEKRGCAGACYIGPNVEVVDVLKEGSAIYNEVTLEKIVELVEECKKLL